MKFYYSFLLTWLVMPMFAQSPAKNDKQLFAEFDKLLSKTFPSKGTGATALVARKGEIIYQKAFGMADLEMEVPMRPEMVFRIGSISKQFTAVAILQLMEQGKLSLQDEITKFIPDYPVQGHIITIEHLLTHTSGIQSYTSMEKWTPAVRRMDMTTKELVNFFKDEPMEFAPTEKWSYNNSGYVLLGYIIEIASGMSYGEYIETNIFQPLDMRNSSYADDSKIIKNRAHGYAPNEMGMPKNADFLSMTQPHAAGSLLSTVEDLYKWNKGIHEGKLIKKENLDMAFQPYILKNKANTNYGYGWMITDLQGSPSVEHSGGINGFLSNALYLPKEDVYVVVLSNCMCIPPNDVSTEIAAWVIGKPFNFQPVKMESAAMDEYTGVYENTEAGQRIITKENDKLFSKRSGGNKFPIFSYNKDKFSFEGSPLSMLEFVRDGAGKISAVKSKSGSSPEVVWQRTDKAIPGEKQAIDLDIKLLEEYVGEYELAPSFILTITLKDKQLSAQATGQGALPIFAEKKDAFFYKAVDAQMEFERDDTGKIIAILFHQGKTNLKGPKLK